MAQVEFGADVTQIIVKQFIPQSNHIYQLPKGILQ